MQTDAHDAPPQDDPILAPEVKPRGHFQPVATGERISSIDVLRGVAILGILVINIAVFAQPLIAMSNPVAFDDPSIFNLGSWFVAHVLFEQKFISIFSMLFGAGLILMTQRAEARGMKFRGVYYRRMLWLLLIGLAHAYFIWYGDILATYALCGLILYPLRRRSPRTLIIIGVILLAVTPTIMTVFGHALEGMRDQAAEIAALDQSELSKEQIQIKKGWDERMKAMAPNQEQLDKEVAAFRGSYGEIIAHQVPIAVGAQISMILVYGLWRVLGLMLIGMALMKLGIFSAARSRKFYRGAVAIGYGIGLPLTIYSAYNLNAHEFDFVYNFQSGHIYNYLGSLLVAFGHIGVIMLLCKSSMLAGLRARLAAVGRAALSNYLLHSVVMTAIFYGWGLGLFGHLSRFALMGVVLAMWTLQLAISKPWLARFRFGPMEWLWRTLTYWRRQPMRVDSSARS